MINTTEKMIKKLKSDQGLIQFLADLLSFPGSEYLNSIKLENDINNILILNENTPINKQLKECVNAYANCDQQVILAEFARLFVGPFHVIAPPYGSYYLENGRLMGESTVQVSEFYDFAGLTIKDSFKDLPDHVVAELEFLIYLIFNEINFLENSEIENYTKINNLKIDFFNRFFLVWINKFATLIIENTKLEFYKNVGICINNIVDILKTDMTDLKKLN
jgi:TorA maturation chaperone TorD